MQGVEGEDTMEDTWVDALTYLPHANPDDALHSPEYPSVAYLCLLGRAMQQCGDPTATAEPLRIWSRRTERVIGSWQHPADAHPADAHPAGALALVGQTCAHDRKTHDGPQAEQRTASSPTAVSSVAARAGFAGLPLSAFLVEAGMRIDPPWVSYATIATVLAKLRLCGIQTTDALAGALHATEQMSTLNQRVRRSGQPAFRARSLDVMRTLISRPPI